MKRADGRPARRVAWHGRDPFDFLVDSSGADRLVALLLKKDKVIL